MYHGLLYTLKSFLLIVSILATPLASYLVGEERNSPTASSEGIQFAPITIDGMTLVTKDFQDPILTEEISFDRNLNFSVKVTNGEDNPEAEGTYTYTQYTSNTATLFLTARVEGGTYTFDYRLNFDDRGSGTFEKTADYGGGEIDNDTGSFNFLSAIESDIDSGPEIVEFDGGDDFPVFFNNLSAEVSTPQNTSRYNLLKGLHELAQIVESAEADSLKTFLNSLGFESSILNFSLSETPLAGEYEFDINRDFQSDKLASMTQNFLIPKVEAVIDNFSKVNQVVTIETSMTGMDEAVVVDATDVKVLNAMANLLATLASIQAGYEIDLNAGHIEDLDNEVEETTVQSFREKYPNLLGIRDVSMHRKAKVFLDSALSTYKTASSELRRQGRYETWGGQELDYLFVLHEEDLEEEEEFLEDLQELHDALTSDYVLEDDDPELNGMKISLSALFEGGLNFARLLPAAERDQFVSDQLTDPTIGGILPGATYANNKVLKELRESFYDDELVLGQRVLPETLSAALSEFDPRIYLELNEELLDNWNVYPYLDSQSEDLENQAAKVC